jgi:hypothetical protein
MLLKQTLVNTKLRNTFFPPQAQEFLTPLEYPAFTYSAIFVMVARR